MQTTLNIPDKGKIVGHPPYTARDARVYIGAILALNDLEVDHEMRQRNHKPEKLRAALSYLSNKYDLTDRIIAPTDNAQNIIDRFIKLQEDRQYLCWRVSYRCRNDNDPYTNELAPYVTESTERWILCSIDTTTIPHTITSQLIDIDYTLYNPDYATINRIPADQWELLPDEVAIKITNLDYTFDYKDLFCMFPRSCEILGHTVGGLKKLFGMIV